MSPVSPRDPFPAHVLSRRTALKALAVGAASLAAGCSRPDETVAAHETVEELPYARLPEGLVPGLTRHYATALPLAGYGRGALVASLEGRPIKVEGSLRHPASLGAADVFAQPEILSLYDPDRSHAIRVGGKISDWPDFESALEPRLKQLEADGGAKLGLLSGRITSPTLLEQIRRLQALFPKVRRYVFEPPETDKLSAAQAVYGRSMILRPRLADADIVVAFAADPLGPGPDQVRFSRALVERRKRDRASSRLYAVEPAMSLTGASADHRLAAPPDAIETMMARLASDFGAPIERPSLPQDQTLFIDAIAKDLKAHPGRGLLMVGPWLPNATTLGVWINDRLDAPIDGFDPEPEMVAEGALSDLAKDIRDGRLETLVIIDLNPAAAAPGDLDFAALIARLPFCVHVGAYFDETAEASTWHLPAPHPLESWSDIAATDGVVCIVQPLIRPLRDSYSAHQIVGALGREAQQSDYDRVRATWRLRWGEQAFEDRWRQTLIYGFIAGAEAEPLAKPSANFPGWTPALRQEGMTAIFRLDPSVFDGRFANNAWLQECPQPFSKSVWGNAIEMSEDDARKLGVAQGDEIEVSSDGRSISGPMRLFPGLAQGVITLSLGYGRTRSGGIGDGVGFNVAALQASASPWILRPVAIRKTGREGRLPPSTAGLFVLEGEATALAPEVGVGGALPRPSQRAGFNTPRPAPVGDPYAWGMVIDTGACTGCNACIVACQSENNVPVIGPEEIDRGRDMHWLRIDVHEHGTEAEPRPIFQPVPCMHCETAPCEPVCPVEASVHDHEGLNVQVYNRCVGTRFCQSNCPYKVRRFNFFGYADGQEYQNLGDALIKAANDPDVTVRARGVMEKCTYCVQRISRARRTAERETRLVAEGEVTPACAAACPTEAIHFSNLADSRSAVSILRGELNHYTLPDELRTRPRTTYLARLRNSNADLGAQT